MNPDVKPRIGETAMQALRHHLMRGVIERVARWSQDFVLHGGYLTREWIEPAPRPTEDLDFVGDFAFDIDDTVERLRPALDIELDDGITIDPAKLVARGIGLEIGFPGVHVDIAVGVERAAHRLGIDIGFGDPLVPPTVTWANGMRVVRPETQLAWKLRSLVDSGDQWHPKDLADIYLIATRVPLDAAQLPAAIEAAFRSRRLSIAQATTAFLDPRWTTKSARVRWASARGLVLDDVIAEVGERLAPAFAELDQR